MSPGRLFKPEALPNSPGRLDSAYFLVTALVFLLLITHGVAYRILLQNEITAPLRSKFVAA